MQTRSTANQTRIILQHTGWTFNHSELGIRLENGGTRGTTGVSKNTVFGPARPRYLVLFRFLLPEHILAAQKDKLHCLCSKYSCLVLSFHDLSYRIPSSPQCYYLRLPEMPGEGQDSGTWGCKCNWPLSRNVTWALQPATTGKAVFGVGNRTGCKLQGEGFGPFICSLGLW